MSSERQVTVEACVDSVAGAVAAERGGAGRIELCDALFDGGTTPSAGMIAACRDAVPIPVFVMIRPRGGGFVYTAEERDVMLRDVIAACELGADGVVIGGLLPDRTIDVELVRQLVDAAHDRSVTFHRAFDFTSDLPASLETLIGAGVKRVLTSGGASTALDGVSVLTDLVRRAGSRITMIAGGGVREENVGRIVDEAGVREVHVRLTRLVNGSAPGSRPDIRLRKPLPDDDLAWEETDAARVRSFVSVLRKVGG